MLSITKRVVIVGVYFLILTSGGIMVTLVSSSSVTKTISSCLLGSQSQPFCSGLLRCDKFKLKNVASVGALLYGLCCLGILGVSFVESYALALIIYGFAGFEFSFIEGC